jgi:type I restriction enzyme S subunit
MSETRKIYRLRDILEVARSPIDMKDEEDYMLASIRRRNGGMFDRETKKGKEILTKTLNRVIPGSFVISKMQVVHGACGMAPLDFGDRCISASYASLLPTEPQRIDIGYLDAYATTKQSYDAFFRASHGVHIEKMTFNLEEWLNREIELPPLPEQKKIAEILSGIDKRITASDNLQKYYLLLLDSVSRDSFKIEAGEIKTLGELAEFKSGRAFKSEELSEDGIKVTRISNLHKPNFPYWRYKGEYNPKIVARDGDILFSWAGVANSINVHRYRGEDSLLNQHIYNFKFDDPLIKEWSYWNLRNMLPKLRESIEGGAGQLHLTKGFIQSLHIPILSRSKMDSLSKCLQSIQTLVEAQKKTSIKLLALKNALLSDLLSGRKGVSI